MAAVGVLPRLTPGTIVRRIAGVEESYVVAREPEERRFFKFEDWEYDLFALLDGTRSLSELAEEFNARHPEIGADVQWMADYVEGLRQIGLIEKSEQERHLVMMDKLKSLRRRRFYDAESTLFEIRVPMLDPDRLMERIMRYIHWWWSPWFVGAWLVAFAVVLGFLIHHWDLYWAGFFEFWNLPEKTVWGWVAFFAVILGVDLWHELGHGFTCKRFGGEVHDIGFMLFYFEPAFYCMVDDSYMFPRRSHRMYAAFGGGYFELMLCSLSLAVWLLTPAEWWIHGAAMTLVFFTGLSAIALNFNPLIKLDGYYVLMDWLDVPNLREDSFEYIGDLAKKLLLRLRVEPKPISRRRRRIYLAYGVLSVVYTAVLFVVLYGFARRWFVGWFGPVGYIVLLGLIAFVFRRRIRDCGRFARHLWLDKREVVRSGRGRMVLGGAAGLAILLLTAPRFPTRVEATFEIEPGQRAVVRAPAEGMVRRVAAGEGERVERGQILAILENPDLAASRAEAGADLERALREAAEARRAGDIASAKERAEEVAEARVRLDLLGGKIMGLALVSPGPGIVTTPNLHEKVGAYLDEGGLFCTIDRLETVRLAVSTSEREIEEVWPGAPARVLATAYPWRTLFARVRSVSPVALPPRSDLEERIDLVSRSHLVRVLVEVDNRDGLLRPGMTGRVQFLTRRRSVAGQVWWKFSRWASLILW